MKKNRLILSITTLALSISMVGIANAATIKDAPKAQPAQSAQHQTYMTQENYDAMKKAMKVTNKDADKPAKPNNKKQNGKQSAQMKSQKQNNASGDFQKKMTEVHKENQEQMQKLHKSMLQ